MTIKEEDWIAEEKEFKKITKWIKEKREDKLGAWLKEFGKGEGFFDFGKKSKKSDWL